MYTCLYVDVLSLCFYLLFLYSYMAHWTICHRLVLHIGIMITLHLVCAFVLMWRFNFKHWYVVILHMIVHVKNVFYCSNLKKKFTAKFRQNQKYYLFKYFCSIYFKTRIFIVFVCIFLLTQLRLTHLF